MTYVNDIFEYLNTFAPITTAASYDNPGLIVGNANQQVKKALLTLDISSKTSFEAVDKNAELIISHHPVIFNPIKKILKNDETAPIYNLINNSLSAICMHTNLDRAEGGVNDALCEKLSLNNICELGELIKRNYKKIVVFVPEGFEDKVRNSMSSAGAGKLGEYDGCAFEANGTGHFRPLEGSKPFISESLKEEKTREVRLEAICEASKVKNVITEMLKVHPYEVPAYDVFDDEAVKSISGIGRIGKLEKKIEIKEFSKIVKNNLNTCCVKYIDTTGMVEKIAVCSGATDEEFILDAVQNGADTILTGEMKHHMYNYCRELGLNAIEAGHFATETIVLPKLKDRLSKTFPNVEFLIAQTNEEPYKIV